MTAEKNPALEAVAKLAADCKARAAHAERMALLLKKDPLGPATARVVGAYEGEAAAYRSIAVALDGLVDGS